MCNALQTAISFRSDSVVSLLDALLKQCDYRHLQFFSSDWIIKQQAVVSPLTREENEALSAFLFSLGKSDLSSQKRAIGTFCDYIEHCEEAYALQYGHDARLFVCLGFFVTALLTLILL